MLYKGGGGGLTFAESVDETRYAFNILDRER